MYLQDLRLRDTVKHCWSQFFDFVFLKVPVIIPGTSNFVLHVIITAPLNMQEIQDRLQNLRPCKPQFVLRADWSKLVFPHAQKRTGEMGRWGDHYFRSTLCPRATADAFSEIVKNKKDNPPEAPTKAFFCEKCSKTFSLPIKFFSRHQALETAGLIFL